MLRQLDGPLAPVSCVSDTAYEACGCPDVERRGLRRVIKEVRDVVVAQMEETALSALTGKRVLLRKMRGAIGAAVTALGVYTLSRIAR